MDTKREIIFSFMLQTLRVVLQIIIYKLRDVLILESTPIIIFLIEFIFIETTSNIIHIDVELSNCLKLFLLCYFFPFTKDYAILLLIS